MYAQMYAQYGQQASAGYGQMPYGAANSAGGSSNNGGGTSQESSGGASSSK